MNREAVALGTPVCSDVRGAHGRSRRAADRRRPAAPARASGSARAERAGAARRGRARARDPRVTALLCSLSSCRRCAPGAPERPRLPPYNPRNAPTDPFGGPPPAPSLGAPAGGGRGAGRARLLPGVPAALQQRAEQGYYALLRNGRSGGCCSGSLPVLVLARVYQRRWRYSGQRDYEAVVRAVVAIVLLTSSRSRCCARSSTRRRARDRRDRACRMA